MGIQRREVEERAAHFAGHDLGRTRVGHASGPSTPALSKKLGGGTASVSWLGLIPGAVARPWRKVVALLSRGTELGSSGEPAAEGARTAPADWVGWARGDPALARGSLSRRRQAIVSSARRRQLLEEREAQVAPGALVGTGPSAARWRPHHHWGAAPETGVSWKKVNLTGRLL